LIDSEFLRFELRQQTDGNSLDPIDAGWAKVLLLQLQRVGVSVLA
jgi:hypothetical protein